MAGQAALWSLLFLGLGACSATPPGVESELNHLSRLDASTAAWVVADACRRALPAADPEPGHAGAPVHRLGPGSYRVRMSAWDQDGFRVFMNGRLQAPDLGQRLETFTSNPGPINLARSRFLPIDRVLGTAKLSDAGLRADIEAVARPVPGGPRSVVELRLYGALPARHLVPRIGRALALADAVQDSARLLREGDFEAADQRILRCLAQQTAGTAGRHPRLRALLLYHRALADRSRGDQGDAHQHLIQALALAPDLAAARILLAEVQAHSGPLRAAVQNLQLLVAARPGHGQLVRHLATLRERARQQRRLGPLPEAARRLAHNDLTGAQAAARDNLLGPRPRARAHRLLATTLAVSAEPQRALEEALAALCRGGPQADLLLRLAELQVQLGQAPAALHLLLHHEALLIEQTPRSWAALRARLLAELPSSLARRICLTRGSQAGSRLGSGHPEQPGPAALALGRRLAELRHRHQHRPGPQPDQLPSRDGYRMAPGVQPPR